jgi:hypothetical protein
MNASAPLIAPAVAHTGVDATALADKVTIENLNFY